jgi:predicted nucleic acid-binding protein
VGDLLVDTDVLINHLRGTCMLVAPKRKRLHFSVVTRCELLSGRGYEEEVIQLLLSSLSEIDINRSIAERAGRLRRHLHIRTPDALIAATALENKLTLLTENTKDFCLVPGLKIQNPKA